MAKPKCTLELIEQAAEMKKHGLSNKDICQALCITEQTFYRWINKPANKLHRSLSESLKKAESEYKAELLEAIMATATREKNPQWTAAAWLLPCGLCLQPREDVLASSCPSTLLSPRLFPGKERPRRRSCGPPISDDDHEAVRLLAPVPLGVATYIRAGFVGARPSIAITDSPYRLQVGVFPDARDGYRVWVDNHRQPSARRGVIGQRGAD